LKVSHRSMNFVLMGITFVVVATPLLWLGGGLYWLEKDVFPAKRPRFMPVDSIWIEGLTLPLSWHHGWWFGCDLSSSELTNYCRLVRANGEGVYAGEYLPCSSHVAIPEANIRLTPPPRDSSDMWLFRWESDAVAGFLADGDLLLPASMQDKCTDVTKQLNLTHQ
jgi:hypothetical protein